MTATSAVNAIQYPDLTDTKDLVAQFATMQTNINTSVVPRFANASARAAAITSPITGQLAYLTTEKILTYYNGTAWSTVAIDQTIHKQSTEQITASTTAINTDDALFFYGEPNSVYRFELMMYYTGNTSSDAISAGITGPTGATMVAGLLVPGTGQSSIANCTVRGGNVALGSMTSQGYHTSAGYSTLWHEKGILKTSSTPGIFQVQWAKPTAYSTPLQVLAGSFLTYRKIS